MASGSRRHASEILTDLLEWRSFSITVLICILNTYVAREDDTIAFLKNASQNEKNMTAVIKDFASILSLHCAAWMSKIAI